MIMEKKDIMLHNTPSFYADYMNRWIEDAKRNGRPAATVVLLEDIRTLVKVAAGVMEPTAAVTKEMN